MLLSVNGHETTVAPEPAQTVSSLVSHLARDLAGQQVLVTSIRINGTDYQPETYGARSAASVGRLEAETEPFAAVSARLLPGAGALVDTLVDACSHAAHELSRGSTDLALSLVSQCIEGLNVLTEMTGQLLVVDPERAAGWAAIDAALPGLEAALNDRDYVRLADELAYELGPALADWQALLTQRAEPGKE